jgi:heat shock protein HslJ
MIRLIAALALLLTPVGAAAHSPIMPAPAIACPAPELVVSGAVSPSDIPVDCMRAYAAAALHSSMLFEELSGGSIRTAIKTQQAATLLSVENYQIIALQGADGLGVRIRNGQLSFRDGQFTGSVGCNHFGGNAAVADNGVVTFNGEIYSTLMFCPDLASVESLFAAIINGDRLVLTPTALISSAGEMTLVPLDTMTGGNGPDDGIGYGIGGTVGGMSTDPTPLDQVTDMDEHRDRHSGSGAAVNLPLLLLAAITGFIFGRATTSAAVVPSTVATAAKPAAKRRKRTTK